MGWRKFTTFSKWIFSPTQYLIILETDSSTGWFGSAAHKKADEDETNYAPKVGDNLVEGPIIDTEREDAVADQDDVDDLLSSLGF